MRLLMQKDFSGVLPVIWNWNPLLINRVASEVQCTRSARYRRVMTHKKTPSHSFIRTTWCCFYPLFCYLCSGLSFHCLVSFIERTNNRSTAHFSKLHSCFNFRSHASGGKLSLFYILLHLIQRYICQCFLIRLSVIDKYVFDIC